MIYLILLNSHSMALESEGRIFRSGEANTLYVSIPSAVATDSAFPFEDGETVTVSIEDGEVRITPTDEEREILKDEYTDK